MVGFLRPILLLPEGIAEYLTPRQLEAVLAHELCHVRRRDNLTSAIHMVVEAIFWFHPLVWWIGARLVDERERACDEAVLSLGNEPHVYAEGILNVCKIYVESPLRCVSGVTGSNLKKRIQAILTGRVAGELNFAKRVALAIAGIAALGLPVLIGVLNAPAIQAQSSATAATKFEVASIKLNTSGSGRFSFGTSPGGKLHIENTSAATIIQNAYGIQSFQLSGGPAWLQSDRYDVEAKAQGNPSSDQMNSMLQALLEDRFKLKVHRTTKELPTYELTVAKGGSKLRPSKDGSCVESDPSNPQRRASDVVCGSVRATRNRSAAEVDAVKINMARLTANLTVYLQRTVIDKTGITGTFDAHLKWSPDEAGDAALASIFTALQEQLGLRLESGKGPVEVIIIDHVERPSAN